MQPSQGGYAAPAKDGVVSYALIGRKRRERTTSYIVRTGGDLERLMARSDELATDPNALPPNVAEAENAVDVVDASSGGMDATVEEKPRLDDVGKGVWHFYQQLKSYYELASAADSIPSLFTSSYYRNQIEGHAKDKFRKVSEVDGLPVYGLTAADRGLLDKKLKRWGDIEEGFGQLSSSMLLSLVASFDSAFSEFAKALLRTRPQRYSGSDKTYSVSQILSIGTVEGLVERVIDDEVDQIMNKSHVDQVAFFEKSFNVKIVEHYDRWADFVEVFERRNLAAHGNLCVNQRYIGNCTSVGYDVSGKSIGDKLEVNSAYLRHALDLLIEFGVLLAFSASQKQAPKSIEDTFTAIIEISFNLLLEEHPEIAKRIVEYALSVKSKGASDVCVKILTVNLAISYKMTANNIKALAVLEAEDWSAANPDFRMCVAAVREDVEEACRLLPLVAAGDQIGPDEVRTWPALQWVRAHPDFIKKAEEVFGERFDTTEKTGTADNEAQASGDGNQRDADPANEAEPSA